MITFDGRWSKAFFAAVCLILLSSKMADAHFLLNLNVRIFHIQHTDDGLRILLRTPMPYIVADKVGEARDGELPEPAPFTRNEWQEETVVHFVDTDSFLANPEGLGRIVGDGLRVVVDEKVRPIQTEAIRIYRLGNEPDFATLSAALASFAMEYNPPGEPLFVGDTVVDVELFVPIEGSVSSYAISSTLNPGLPGQEDTANLILDHGPGDPKIFRSRGLLLEPVIVTQSGFAAIRTFVWEGVRHILEGIDHVLFVVCLVIGAPALTALLWRVTGFTVGHSVTLAIGFFGFVPSGAWFVPAVECGIALSIVYAAAIAMRSDRQSDVSNPQMLAITTAMGLLHGLGFSFVLHRILQVDSPNVWQSLLAFNVGVEIGQILIVLAIWPALALLSKLHASGLRIAKNVLAGGCIIIAGYWTVERFNLLVASI